MPSVSLRPTSRRRTAPIATLLIKALRGPLESARYTSVAFGKTMQQAGILPSMGRRGDAFDNAVAESFFATLETELLDRHTFRSRDQARLALFRWIEGFYNSRRRHSTLGQRSPQRYEEIMINNNPQTAVAVST